MDWEGADTIYRSSRVGHRRVVEGALINICNTLDGNKAFTNEDRQTDRLVCHSINLNLKQFLEAPDTVSPSSLPAQVVEVAVVTETTGTDAESHSPPANHLGTSNEHPIIERRQLRRSRRLAQRYEETAIT